MRCRICETPLGKPDYSADAPSLTDCGRIINIKTEIYFCNACGLSQSPNIPDIINFYAHEYKISLQAPDHDQLVSLKDGRSLYRTDLQAQLVLKLAPPIKGGRILDFGCGKATSLQKITRVRPDVKPFVFDVSDDYRESWADWVPIENCATHSTPESWSGNFDLVTCHFVLEHVVNITDLLAGIRGLLSPQGLLFLSVPNALANPGDLLVVDHLTHFSQETLANALSCSGLELLCMDTTSFPGALLSVSRSGIEKTSKRVVQHHTETLAMRKFALDWASIRTRVREAARRTSSAPAAIYGAGFYGSFIRSILGPDVNLRYFVDSNPHLQGTMHMGLPVIAPASMSEDICVVYIGLNPIKARSIIANHPSISARTIVWLD